MNRLRKVETADAAAIADIYRHYVEETTTSFEFVAPDAAAMEARIRNFSSRYPYFVSVGDDGAVNGYCYAHAWKERPAYAATWEVTIYLRHGCEGQGIGRMLMEKLVEECRSRGAKVLIACITAENLGSIAFHTRMGFRKVAHFEKVGVKFGRELDVVDMQFTFDC